MYSYLQHFRDRPLGSGHELEEAQCSDDIVGHVAVVTCTEGGREGGGRREGGRVNVIPLTISRISMKENVLFINKNINIFSMLGYFASYTSIPYKRIACKLYLTVQYDTANVHTLGIQ